MHFLAGIDEEIFGGFSAAFNLNRVDRCDFGESPLIHGIRVFHVMAVAQKPLAFALFETASFFVNP